MIGYLTIGANDLERAVKLHDAPLATIRIGGENEGCPSPRGEHGVYAGSFRDLDGNKLNANVPAPD